MSPSLKLGRRYGSLNLEVDMSLKRELALIGLLIVLASAVLYASDLPLLPQHK